MKLVTIKSHPFTPLLYSEYFLLLLLLILINNAILPDWLFFHKSSPQITFSLNLLVIVFAGIGSLLPWKSSFSIKVLFVCFELFLMISILYLGGGRGCLIPYLVFILRNIFLFNGLKKNLIILGIVILGLMFNLMFMLNHIESVFPFQNNLNSQLSLSFVILFFLIFTLILFFFTVFLNFIVIEKKAVVKIDMDKIPQIQKLTERQKEILKYFLNNQCPTNKELAEGLYLAEGTIKNHFSNIMQRLGVGNRTELALFKDVLLLELQEK